MIETVLFSAFLPFAVFALLTAAMPNTTYEMDWGNERGSFFAPYALYRRLAYVIYGSGFIVALLFSYHQHAVTATLMTSAAIYALLFNAWTAIAYESYLHSKYGRPGASNYTRFKYAITLALGYSASITFVAGMIAAVPALLRY